MYNNNNGPHWGLYCFMIIFLHFIHEDTDMRAGEQVGEGGGVEQI